LFVVLLIRRIGTLNAIFVGDKTCICGLAEVLNPQKKRLGPKILQSATFAEGLKICDLLKF
jgi:hypothetical protein